MRRPFHSERSCRGEEASRGRAQEDDVDEPTGVEVLISELLQKNEEMAQKMDQLTTAVLALQEQRLPTDGVSTSM